MNRFTVCYIVRRTHCSFVHCWPRDISQVGNDIYSMSHSYTRGTCVNDSSDVVFRLFKLTNTISNSPSMHFLCRVNHTVSMKQLMSDPLLVLLIR